MKIGIKILIIKLRIILTIIYVAAKKIMEFIMKKITTIILVITV
jgi:hypothetical protein